MAFLKAEEQILIPESQIGDDLDHHLSDTNSMFRILRAGMFLSCLLKKERHFLGQNEISCNEF